MGLSEGKRMYKMLCWLDTAKATAPDCQDHSVCAKAVFLVCMQADAPVFA